MPTKPQTNLNRRLAFSLVELVIVVVIFGTIAAIAVPRMSRSTRGASDAAILADLQIMRRAIELYYAEHESKYPASLVAITKYTSTAGAMSNNPSAVYIHPPYVRAIPACPTGPNKGATGWAAANANPPTVVSALPTTGWLYHWQTGGVWVNDINHLDK